jgi:hypothetical protein
MLRSKRVLSVVAAVLGTAVLLGTLPSALGASDVAFFRAFSAATRVFKSTSVHPVARWHMDETSGRVMHDSSGSHNGTLRNVHVGRASFSGTGYGFNGKTSYVAVPSAANLNPGRADLTFTIHLRTTGTPPRSPDDWDLFRKGHVRDRGEYKMELQPTGRPSCGFEGTAGYRELVARPAINDGRWHTVSCVKTATAIEVVVDGHVFSKAAKVGSIANASKVIIGAHSTGGPDWYRGRLDEASIEIG